MPARVRVSLVYILGLSSLLCSLPHVYASVSNKWLDVPFVQQVRTGCGSAAVAMVIEYWARQYPVLQSAAEEAGRIDRLLPASRRGIQGRALRAYLEQRGFLAFVFDGELSDLQHHLQKGRPVIVCFEPKGIHASLHYAVIVGVDDGRIWMNDPSRGKLFDEDLDRFLAEWKSTQNWALLAVPRQIQ